MASKICVSRRCENKVVAPTKAFITWKKYCSRACGARTRNERYWAKKFEEQQKLGRKPNDQTAKAELYRNRR